MYYATRMLLLLRAAASAAPEVGPVEHEADADMCPLLMAFIADIATPEQTQDLVELTTPEKGKEMLKDTDRHLQSSYYETIHTSFDLFTEFGITDPRNFYKFHDALVNLEFSMRQMKALVECIVRQASESQNKSELIRFTEIVWNVLGYPKALDANGLASGDEEDVAAIAIRHNLVAKRDQWGVFAGSINNKLAYEERYHKCDAQLNLLANNGVETAQLTAEVNALVDAGTALRQKVEQLKQPTPEAVLAVLIDSMEASTKALYDKIVIESDALGQLLLWIVRDAMSIQQQTILDLKRRIENLQTQVKESEEKILKNQDQNTAKIVGLMLDWTRPTGWPFRIFCLSLIIPLFFLLSGIGVCVHQVMWCGKYQDNTAEVHDAAILSLQLFTWASGIAAADAVVYCFYLYPESTGMVLAVSVASLWYRYGRD